MRAALDFGVADIFGIDGADIPLDQLLFDSKWFKRSDLTDSIDLGRRFDAVLCLEVAEHLDPKFAPVLIQTLTRHSDKIIFSAGCPGQFGQHHINCQWPEYWQELFNRHGFVCEDSLRWQIWSAAHIEPWYRQNLILARRDVQHAGSEPRIPAVIHPEMIPEGEVQVASEAAAKEQMRLVEQGHMPVGWYFSIGISGLIAKFRRHF